MRNVRVADAVSVAGFEFKEKPLIVIYELNQFKCIKWSTGSHITFKYARY